MKECSYTDPVRKLLTYGDAGSFSEWPNYRELGLSEHHIPELIRMLTDDELYTAGSEGPEVWAPLHAWRALGQLHAVEAIDALLRQLYRIDEEHDDWIGDEFPEVFAMIGASAIPELKTYLATEGHGLYARVCASHSLANIGKSSPEALDRCADCLTYQLTKYAHNDPTLNGFLISYLLDLNAVDSISTIRQAYTQHCVDLSIVGDLEKVEMGLGIRQKRSTPSRGFQWVFEGDEKSSKSNTGVIASGKIGRNQPCPCGSGKKYKKCCLHKV